MAPPEPDASETQLVLIPSYNTGPKLFEVVRAARRHWRPVWIVIDGSTDGTDAALAGEVSEDTGIELIILPRNSGKGAAILHGVEHARARGFRQVLTMDADGQHPADRIPDFMAAARANPDTLILGLPVFDASAPAIRLAGRRISNGLARVETLDCELGDVLFGFRVYPIAALIAVMQETRWMRRYDFDPEAAVRLCWRGVRPINLPAPVRYFRPEEGGVSHFSYLRDNLRLGWMHVRLIAGMVRRSPRLARRRGFSPLRSSRH